MCQGFFGFALQRKWEEMACRDAGVRPAIAIAPEAADFLGERLTETVNALAAAPAPCEGAGCELPRSSETESRRECGTSRRERSRRRAWQVVEALPDLAALALPPRSTADISAVVGRISGTNGLAVGILVAPLLAVSKVAGAMGVNLTADSLGLGEADLVQDPLLSSERLDSLEVRMMRGSDGAREEPNWRCHETPCYTFTEQSRSAGRKERVTWAEHDSVARGVPVLVDGDGDHADGFFLCHADGSLQAMPAKAWHHVSAHQNEESVAADADDDAEGDVLCAICQCDFKEGEYGLIVKACQHAFHAKCLSPWLDRSHTCPCCRRSLRDPTAGTANASVMHASVGQTSTSTRSDLDPVAVAAVTTTDNLGMRAQPAVQADSLRVGFFGLESLGRLWPFPSTRSAQAVDLARDPGQRVDPSLPALHGEETELTAASSAQSRQEVEAKLAAAEKALAV